VRWFSGKSASGQLDFLLPVRRAKPVVGAKVFTSSNCRAARSSSAARWRPANRRDAGSGGGFVQAKIAGDGEKPRGEFGGDLITMRGLVDLEKNILRHVLGLGLVAQRGGRQVFIDRLLVFPTSSVKAA